ncbi:MAG TPA: sn-glycerol-3-phosphate ABC transporter ATP-binding protein UgpC [Chondromyces sp.]|nr:sn-glycerol-3-phosphate ABC transporter ATP-binding protein UgpC [Chondromyces sp.]
MAEINLQHLYKMYNKHVMAVEDFTLTIKDKEFIVLAGPSGCGKSTLLRMVAGLESISRGELFVDGERMNDVPPNNRDVAMVFQNYALYPHMTVYQNMAFGLKLRKFSKNEIDRRVKEVARTLSLEPYLNRKPKALSGGQCQRVALGRAMARDAKLFLMDEPLSNLDAKLRVQMRTEITKLHQRLQTTTIYVTHDQTEAMTMATRLVVMNNGAIQQVGTPKEVYEKPKNIFVGGFIGSPAMNFFTGSLMENKVDIGHISLMIPERKMNELRRQGYVNKKIIIGIRPEHFHEKAMFIKTSAESIIHIKIEAAELVGHETIIYSQISNQPFSARVNSSSKVTSGQVIRLAVDMDNIHFFDFQTTNRIHLEEE